MRLARALFALAIASACGCPAEAVQLKVAPARFILHDIQPGLTYDMYKETGLRLTIFNDDNVSRSWNLTTHRPSERGDWEKGYNEIPDASWCWFERDEVKVPANGVENVNFFLSIPEEERYFNQRWVVTLGVGGGDARGLSVAVDIRAQLETAPKSDIKARPQGLLGIKPSVLEFEGMRLGEPRKAEVTLYNNNRQRHDYTVDSLFRESEIDSTVYLKHSYKAVADPDWIQHERSIGIEPEGQVKIPIQACIPSDAACDGEKWEEILMIKSGEQYAGFLRIHLNLKEE